MVANRSDAPVAWLRLRLRAFDETPGRGRPAWRSDWLYAERLGPGESVALELSDLPVAPEIELSVVGAGRSGPPRPGRAARRVERCSEPALLEALRDELGERSAQVTVHPMRRSAAGSALVADGME